MKLSRALLLLLLATLALPVNAYADPITPTGYCQQTVFFYNLGPLSQGGPEPDDRYGVLLPDGTYLPANGGLVTFAIPSPPGTMQVTTERFNRQQATPLMVSCSTPYPYYPIVTARGA